ncbi:MAG TPA: proton-conducting transporter membrane subunit [Solirubrobacteraceae bacterium]|nr:proton-conducting transporter membrane subunit [Solirubrobacteraceae bacterium]
MAIWLLIMLALPFAAAAATLALGDRRLSGRLSAGAGVGSFAVALVVVFGDHVARGRHALGNTFFLDGLSGVFLIAVAFVYAVVAVYSMGYLLPGIGHIQLRRWYWPLLDVFGLALLATPIVANLGVLWVAVELTTVVSALLVTAEGSDESLEAGWKYIVIGSSGLAAGLLGIVLIYAAGVPSLGDHYAPTYTTLTQAGAHLTPSLVRTGFAFVLVGFGTKVGLVPMHAWLPDAHSEGPSPVSAMLSGALLAGALYAVLRLGAVAQLAVGPTYVHVLLLVFGGLSLLLAAFFVLRQNNYKRLLAYSSIEHMGIVTLGIGIGGPIAAYGAFFHVIVHAAGKTLAFFGAGDVLSRYETRDADAVRGVIRVAPFTGAMVLLGALAITGVPPFGLFRSELLIVTGGFSQSKYALAGLLIVLVNVAFVGVYQLFHRMVISTAEPNARDRARLSRPEQPLMAAAMLASLAVVLVLGVWIPSPLNQLLHAAASVIGGRV